MAELYQEAAVPATEPAAEPDDLPGLSAIGSQQLLHLRFDQVLSALTRLSDRVATSGLSIANLKALVSEAAQQCESGGEGPLFVAQASIRKTVLDLHIGILDALTAADATVGKAYGLGRALADLTLRPAASTRAAFEDDFSGRVATLKGWLHDLKTVLPDHAAVAVRLSLGYWQQWINDTAADDPVWAQLPDWADPIHPDSTISVVTDTLSTQGSRWRAILTGEKRATDLLSADDFVDAAEAMSQRVATIGRRFWAQYRIGIAIGVVVLGAIVALLVLESKSSLGGLGAIGAIAGATGVTWKGVQSTLGSAVRKVEPSLWGAELDQVITVAMTVLPGTSEVALVVPKASGFARTKEPPALELSSS